MRAYAGYSLNGLNNSLLGSVNRLTSAEFGNMSLGVRYSYILGQRAERAAVGQAELAMTRQAGESASGNRVPHSAASSRGGLRPCEVELRRVSGPAAAIGRRQSSGRYLRELHAAGEIDLDRLLRARIQWLSAEQQVRNSLIDYNLALNSWRFATGEMTTSMRDTPANTPARTRGESTGTLGGSSGSHY